MDYIQLELERKVKRSKCRGQCLFCIAGETCSGEFSLVGGGTLLVSLPCHVTMYKNWPYHVTFRAFWPYETLLLPKRHILRLTDLTAEEKKGY